MMPKKPVAHCGLVCPECPAYIAKRTSDDALRQRTARSWSGPGFEVAAQDVNCDGCLQTDGELFKHCAVCDVRACASSRGLGTCAECAEYSCDKLERLFGLIGQGARATLEDLRAG
jgi:hypothetical protein